MAFKSNDRTFEKVYSIFDKKDYFNAKGLAKTQIGNFERALQRNDKGAQQILDKFKGDMGKAKEYINQVISDQKKQQAFEDYKALKTAVDSLQKGKPMYGAADLVKSRAHNNSQKYTMALYSALRGKKFNNYKDIHADVDSLIGESVNEGKKRYYQQDRVGSAKYTISYHDGKQKHKDGSDFFGIQTFKNKKDLAKFVNTLNKSGYVYGFDESVNEGIIQDREKQLKNLKQGGSVSGGGYGTFKKTGRDTFVSPKGKKYNSSALIKLIGTFGDFTVNEDKGEVEKIKKQVGNNEIKFYDALSKVEKRLGSKYPKFLDTALKQLKQNPSKFKTNADKEEAIFQSVK